MNRMQHRSTAESCPISLAETLRFARAWGECHGWDTTPLDRLRYRHLLDLAIAGRLPADRIDGKWFVRAAQPERIALALGMTPTASATVTA